MDGWIDNYPLYSIGYHPFGAAAKKEYIVSYQSKMSHDKSYFQLDTLPRLVVGKFVVVFVLQEYSFDEDVCAALLWTAPELLRERNERCCCYGGDGSGDDDCGNDDGVTGSFFVF